MHDMMDKLPTPLKALVRDIQNAYPDKMAVESVLNKLRLTMPDFTGFDNFEDGSYARNLIHKEDDFEILLMCWDANQCTPIHDHGGNACWMYMIEGTLTEETYVPGDNGMELIESVTAKAGEWIYADDARGAHVLKNDENRACSLHIYANPIEECRQFKPCGAAKTVELEPDFTPEEVLG